MLNKRIIPCLDVTGGRVVKGISFVQLRDAGDPVELGSFYSREGADELVFLDITASAEERNIMVDVVERVSRKVFIPFTVGGGLRDIDDMRRILEAGADKVSINTAAVQDPGLVARGAGKFGSQCIVVAVDARRIGGSPPPDLPHRGGGRNFSLPRWEGLREGGTSFRPGDTSLDATSGWEVYLYGGRKPAGVDAVKWAVEAARLGAGEILLTSMDADGHQTGYDLELTRTISESVSIPVIASGGAGGLEHLYAALSEGKADAVLAASIFHYGKYTIRQAKDYLAGRGVPVRF